MTRFILALAFVLATIATVLPVPALAQDRCADPIVDLSGRLENEERVLGAIRDLEGKGAQVRVWLLSSLAGQPTLDQYMASVRSRCPSWQATDGDYKSTFIVLAVSLSERDVGLWAGGQWREELGDAWPAILENEMKPSLRDGDFDLAFASGLSAITAQIERSQQRALAPAQGPVIIREQTAPADYSGLWSFLMWAGIVLTIGFALFFGLRVWRDHRARVEANRKARAKAVNAYGTCTSAINRVNEELPIVKARIGVLAKSHAEQQAASWHAEFNDIEREFSSESGQFSALRYDPHDESLSEGEYGQMEEAFSAAGKRLAAIEGRLDALTQDCTQAQALAEQLPGELERIAEVITHTEQRISAVKEQGFVVAGGSAVLKQCRTALTKARTALAAKLFAQAKSLSDKAERDALQFAKEAETYPATKARLTARHEQLTALMPARTALIVETGNVFDDMEHRYDPSCFHSVEGNGSIAERLVRDATEQLEAAAQAVVAEDWQQADEHLESAGSALERIESLMHSIVVLKETLEQAAQDLPGEIREARADIERARTYVTQHDDDTSDRLFGEIDRAELMVQEADDALTKERPHYLSIIDSVEKAHGLIDQILATARSEVEQAERQRQLARSSLRNAAAAVAAVKEYIQDHRSDVGMSAEQEAHQAQRLLTAATEYHQRGNLVDAIRGASAAREKAELALNSAKRDYRDAEDARESARRAAEARRRASESSYSNTSIGGGFSPGRSSGGSFGGSFGGSSSFGGGGSRSFGGSSKW